MGSRDDMISRIDDKLKSGFTTIKIKVGAIDFDSELDLIKHIRKVFPPEAVTIRLDANGGFSLNDAMDKLERLSNYGIHSIERPIKAGQWDEMGKLCANSPIPIALDEELIGLFKTSERIDMLNAVKPAFLILKPSLIGGFSESLEWMRLAKRERCWWLGYFCTGIKYWLKCDCSMDSLNESRDATRAWYRCTFYQQY